MSALHRVEQLADTDRDRRFCSGYYRPHQPCDCCRGMKFWRSSISDLWICVRCHPPVSLRIVAERIELEARPNQCRGLETPERAKEEPDDK